MNEFLKKEARTANSTYQKAGFRVPKTVLWLIEHLFFKSSFVIKAPPFG
jgi:hypothetical protein